MITFRDMGRHTQAMVIKEEIGDNANVFVDMSTTNFKFYFVKNEGLIYDVTRWVNAVFGTDEACDAYQDLTIDDLIQAFSPVGQHLNWNFLPILVS